ncbi:MAG: hypothetical protein K0Q48_3268 [Bacillota bacterium]|nr:hypothetical protein [Bacillota bacterium]
MINVKIRLGKYKICLLQLRCSVLMNRLIQYRYIQFLAVESMYDMPVYIYFIIMESHAIIK